MDWLGDGVNGPLAIVRAVHFGAAATTAGTLIFRAVVVEPASHAMPTAIAVARSQIRRVAWVSLAVATLSGAIWVLLQAAAISGLSLKEAMAGDVLSVVVNETQFGFVSEIRLVLAIILAGCLMVDRLAPLRWSGLASALGLIAAIAWTGHAGSGVGELGVLQLAADVLHLIAAAAWLGGLVSLALLLRAARRHDALAWASVARDATRRFSTLGIVSVGMILATGMVNSWILVGSLHALTVTEYGRLLMLKIALFAAMLLIAGVNRFWLTPQLALRSGSQPQLRALRQLAHNSVIEITLGLVIFAVVGALGTMHPAIHLGGGSIGPCCLPAA
jgi:copper resistance protein D